MAQKSEAKQTNEGTASKQSAPSSVQPVESKENTGNAQQSQKGALEHNVSGQAHRHPATVPGQHATGSFTDDASKTK
jgi:hypothetical protein